MRERIGDRMNQGEKHSKTVADFARKEEPMPEQPEEAGQWKEPDVTMLTMAERCVYQNRRRALELHRKGCTAVEVFKVTGLNHAAVMRLWKRCCARDPETGSCFGYEALVPRSKMKEYIR